MTTYLDCAATSPIDPAVQREVMHFLVDEYGNAGSRTHGFGARAKSAVEKARDQVAAAVGCTRGEVVFTSGATESDNLAILGLADFGRRTGRMHLVSTEIEHNAVLEPLRELERRGFEVTLVRPGKGGWVEAKAVREAMRADTLLVSVMRINNETGVIQPVEEIARELEDHPAYFHVDAAQGFGDSTTSLADARIDLISLSAHKMYGPKGVGALITRRRNGERPPLMPLMFGGGQERGLRPGTLPVHLIVGMGKAAELAILESAERRRVNLAFRERALKALAGLGVKVNGDQGRVVPHILNVSFSGVEAEEAVEALAEVIAVSNGSACASQSLSCSHVLGAMGLGPDEAAEALRLSWCHMTPEPDWEMVVGILRGLQGG